MEAGEDFQAVQAVLEVVVLGDSAVAVRVEVVQVAAGKRDSLLQKKILNYFLHDVNIHLHTKSVNRPNSSFALMIKSVRFASDKFARRKIICKQLENYSI